MRTNSHKYKSGFTLAEVLITLAVIGVLAAMAIPSLQNNIQNNEYKTSYRKAYSDLSNAFNLCKAENRINNVASTTDFVNNKNNFDCIKSKMNFSKECYNNNNSDCWNWSGETSSGAPSLPGTSAFIDSAGRAWTMRDDGSFSYSSTLFLFDTNGNKGPNRFGKDRWSFAFLDINNLVTGSPVKISTTNFGLPIDFTTPDAWSCPTPPCYYKSWLIGAN